MGRTNSNALAYLRSSMLYRRRFRNLIVAGGRRCQSPRFMIREAWDTVIIAAISSSVYGIDHSQYWICVVGYIHGRAALLIEISSGGPWDSVVASSHAVARYNGNIRKVENIAGETRPN